MEMIEAYPLHWPIDQPRTVSPKRAAFTGTHGRIQNELIKEIHLLGGRDIIISTNIQLRRDGLPYASQKPPEDKGVAVYFELDGKSLVFACDKWLHIHHNMRAIQKTIEAMRGMERWGVSDMLNRAFTGFKAIPESITPPWAQVLDVSATATQKEIIEAYRKKVKETHPDKGGSAEAFNQVQEAYRQATK
jgi:hypothetical protein